MHLKQISFWRCCSAHNGGRLLDTKLLDPLIARFSNFDYAQTHTISPFNRFWLFCFHLHSQEEEKNDNNDPSNWKKTCTVFQHSSFLLAALPIGFLKIADTWWIFERKSEINEIMRIVVCSLTASTLCALGVFFKSVPLLWLSPPIYSIFHEQQNQNLYQQWTSNENLKY